jgi:streptogramin lyase
MGVAVDSAGNLFVADTYNDTIRKVSPAGAVTTIAGSAGISGAADLTGVNALFNQPAGLGVDAAGNVYVADTGNATIRKIVPTGEVTTLAGMAGIAGRGDGSGGFSLFNQPHALAVGGAGDLFVADTGNGMIRRVSAAGEVSTLALTTGSVNPPPPGGGSNPPPGTGGGDSGGGGGGGAPSLWFYGALILLASARMAAGATRSVLLKFWGASSRGPQRLRAPQALRAGFFAFHS